MTAACHLIRQQVLEIPLDQVEVGDHLQDCAACRKLIQTLKEELAVLDEALDQFVDADGFAAAYAKAPQPRRWGMPVVALGIVTALAAALAWSVCPSV